MFALFSMMPIGRIWSTSGPSILWGSNAMQWVSFTYDSIEGAAVLFFAVRRANLKNGKKVVLVTHHIHEIPPEITRVIMIKKGQLVDDGKKEEILTNSKLTSLFDWPIKVIKENGYYQTIPG